ncbi:MAG: hypothetical protein O3A93_13615 [Chloroflexi bacterium]|nr:hypothetical protein [Chloroflexota bacterium]
MDELPADSFGEVMCDGCGKFTASTAWYERRVESHLCAEQMEKDNFLLDQGHGDFLRQVGLQEGVDYLPIEGEQPCDYPEGNPLMGQELMECTRAAKFAKMVEEIYNYCNVCS